LLVFWKAGERKGQERKSQDKQITAMKIYMAHPTSGMGVQNRNAYSFTLVIPMRYA
jgi:hypothetical protein